MAVQLSEEMRKCGACGKNVKRAKRFYRNGRYYCNENCWRKKAAEKKGGDPEQAAS